MMEKEIGKHQSEAKGRESANSLSELASYSGRVSEATS